MIVIPAQFDFIKKARLIHGDKYDYSQIEYKNSRTKIVIICKIHGPFQQTPHCHIQKRGCPECGNTKLYDTCESFIRKANKIHNGLYVYSKVAYEGHTVKVDIECARHGVFKQEPRYHLRGSGCPKCANEKLKEPKTKTSDFINAVKAIHDCRYGYDIDYDFLKLSDQIKIRCPRHGWFTQTAINHQSGKGCAKCGQDRSIDAIKYSHDEYVSKARAKHGDTYDYKGYKGANKPIEIICFKHGSFSQIATEHLRGAGCPSCALTISTGHKELIGSLSVDCLVNDRTIIKPYEIDVYIPDYRLGIEFHGGYWHSYNKKESVEEKSYHQKKSDLARKAGIKLLQFYDFEWKDKRGIVDSIINHHIGKSMKVYARKCDVVSMTNSQAREFFASTHLSGHRDARYCYGLTYDGMIICAMSASANSGSLEIIRFATALNYTVVGGASRLLKKLFEINDHIITFADRRISTGNVYEKSGFKMLYETDPNYCYLNRDGTYAYSRQQCQKHKLKDLLGVKFDNDLTEYENMFNAGYRRLWDAGHIKYEISKYCDNDSCSI